MPNPAAPPPDQFLGIAMKLRWVHDQIIRIEQAEFDASKHYRESISVSDDPTKRESTYQLDRDISVPFVIPVLIGATLQALRSSLDYLAFELCRGGPGGPDAAAQKIDKIYFPISLKDEAAYKALESRRIIESLARPGVVDAIDRIQPYRGGAGQYLTLLHDLNRIDKHRLLLTASFTRPDRDITNSEAFGPQITEHRRLFQMGLELARGIGGIFTPPPPRVVKAGDVLFRLSADQKAKNKEVMLLFHAAINEPLIMPLEPAVEFLERIAGAVERIMPAFFQFFAPVPPPTTQP